ncbi:MAG: pimeloyl-ACP methyl ester carboxylesterase [Planctomycetota bacterium]|jgi:pimeloyl-ACP methyl ester carboxylesterase
MEPFYFEAEGQSLFGCYHAAATPARDCALVLANPLGHEYVQFHRVYRQLAIMLADAGFPVLRFDYTGTGDSSGDYPDWSLDRWRQDLQCASTALQKRASSSSLAMVGLRVGASLALETCTQLKGVDSLVLWDPIVAGAAHVGELRAGHASMMGYAHVIPKPEANCSPEALGFAFPDSVAQQISKIDLLSQQVRPARRVLLIESNDAVPQQALSESLGSTGANVTFQQYSNPHLWVWTEDFAKMHVPRRILQATVDWLSEEYA